MLNAMAIVVVKIDCAKCSLLPVSHQIKQGEKNVTAVCIPFNQEFSGKKLCSEKKNNVRVFLENRKRIFELKFIWCVLNALKGWK